MGDERPISDLDLLRRFMDGREDAFDALWQRHEGRVRAQFGQHLSDGALAKVKQRVRRKLAKFRENRIGKAPWSDSSCTQLIDEWLGVAKSLADEIALVERIRAGDNVAFEAFWTKYEQPLLSTARRYAGQHAEVAMGNAKSNALLAAGTITKPESFAAFLNITVRNKAIDIRISEARPEQPVIWSKLPPEMARGFEVTLETGGPTCVEAIDNASDPVVRLTQDEEVALRSAEVASQQKWLDALSRRPMLNVRDVLFACPLRHAWALKLYYGDRRGITEIPPEMSILTGISNGAISRIVTARRLPLLTAVCIDGDLDQTQRDQVHKSPDEQQDWLIRTVGGEFVAHWEERRHELDWDPADLGLSDEQMIMLRQVYTYGHTLAEIAEMHQLTGGVEEARKLIQAAEKRALDKLSPGHAEAHNA